MKLYPGDNGVHFFYENEKEKNKNIIIARNHNEKYWCVYVDIKMKYSTDNLEDAVKSASKHARCKVEICRDKVWCNDAYSDKLSMVLVSVPNKNKKGEKQCVH